MCGTIIKTGRRESGTTAIAVAPLVALPIIAYALYRHPPAWQLMWILAISIYSGLKWFTLAFLHPKHASIARMLAYLILWPGMNVKAFLDSSSHPKKPNFCEWTLAIINLAAGLLLLFTVVPHFLDSYPIVAGWAGMAGLVLVLHFGIFHVLSLCWRLCGIHAEPIMNFPILASSLGDFWGRRWNLAFRDLAFGYVFRPLVNRLGVAGATMAVFVVSGLIHDLVISVPVQAGWGGPTLYFTFQGIGLLLERSRVGHRLGLRKGFTGRLFCGLCTVGPVALLFHEPYVRHAILPTLSALGVV